MRSQNEHGNDSVFSQSRRARFPDRLLFFVLLSLRQLIFHGANNLAWDDEENSPFTGSRLTKMEGFVQERRQPQIAY